MTSLQEPAAGSKSAKFVAADPLAPMVDPFQHLNDEQRDVQQVLAENVNKRLEKAMDELKDKHAKGTNEIDDPDRAPTGAAYRQIQQQQQQALAMQKENRRQIEQQKQQEERERQELRSKVAQQVEDNGNNIDNDSDDDDEFDDLLDDDNDPVLEALRQKRLAEMKQAQAKKAENIAKGHGQYRTITQDEFLPECTGSSEWVAMHFFHKEFQRCQIMDHHLKLIAPKHVTCKFLRIDAEKAPFFVSKLVIRTLPTVIVFQEGKAVARLVGFEGLMTSSGAAGQNVDNFPTHKLQQWLASTGAIEFDIAKDEMAREELLAEEKEQQRSGGRRQGRAIWSTAKQLDDLVL